MKFFNLSIKILKKKFNNFFIKNKLVFSLKKNLYNYDVFITKKFFEKKFFFNYSFNNNSFKKRFIFYQNMNNLTILINSLMSDGKKIKFLKFINQLNDSFYYNFTHKNNLLANKFSNYTLFYDFARNYENFFNIDFILISLINLNQSVFISKIIRLNKRKKKQLKKKFELKIKYLRKNKRISNVFKSINTYSNTFNYYKYHERLLITFLYCVLDQENSFISKKKAFTYSSVLKQHKGKSFN